MQNGYNKISGKKTLVLITGLIVVIIFLSIYSVFLMLRKSSVLTDSSSFEKPDPTATPVPEQQIIPTSVQKFGD